MSEQVPEGWDMNPLGAIVTEHNSGIYKKADLYGSGTNIIGVSDLYKCDFVKGQIFRKVPLSESESKKHTLQYGDLIYGESSLVRSGIAKTVCVTPAGEGTAFAWHTRRFRVNFREISPEYLHYFLSAPKARNYLERVCTQTALTGITTVDFFNVPVLLPPLPEQQKIASILTSVDEVIENTQSQIDKLQDLKKATMNELLTKGIGHTEFKDSELGRIPKSWEVYTLQIISSKDRYAVVGGPFGSDLTSKDYVSSNGVPVIRGLNLVSGNGLLNEEEFVYVSPEKAAALSRNTARRGDFVFTQRGTMGQVAFIPSNSKFNSYVISQSQMKLTPDECIIDKHFLMSWVTSDIFLRKIDEHTIATGLPHINLGILKELPILLPDLEEQRIIAKKLLAINDYIEGKYKHLRILSSLKKSLMQDLLTGKVRVQVN